MAASKSRKDRSLKGPVPSTKPRSTVSAPRALAAGAEAMVAGAGVQRPFYVIGHNPNTVAEARAFIDGGANALEPDVNVFEHDETRLCISHGLGGPDAPDLVGFFGALNQLASEHPRFALLYLDCKPKVATPGHMAALVNAVRTQLTVGDGSELKVIYSVPSLIEANAAFPAIAHDLRSNEMLMIDQENDPLMVTRFFSRLEIAKFIYGNGDSVPLLPTSPFFPHVFPAVQQACQLKETGQGPCLVIAWTFNTTDNQKAFIDCGVDGIIVDRPDLVHPDGLGNLTHLVDASPAVRLALRDDAFG